jgi:hypothetical protein
MTCSAQGFCNGPGTGAGSDDADTCFGTEPFHVCLAAPPTVPLSISGLGTAIDTNAKCAATLPTDSQGCVLAATTITIDGTLRATGSRPLVLIASGTITITRTGLIDVGSHRGATSELGAGAEPQDCSQGQPPTFRSGGAGGSFRGLGGMGGPSSGTDPGGTPGPVTAANKLRGGCAGQDARVLSAPQVQRGHGGGAVLLIAGRSISVDEGGAINAAGEGGEGGPTGPNGGGAGGGGGSGGMIVLDAPTIASSGLILASGGGGGGGNSIGSTSNPGKPGADPTSAVPAAAGGAGGADAGGSGGDGSSAATAAGGGNGLPGISAGSDGRGGGGGGGAGIVKAPGMATLGGQVSPMPTP